VALLLAACGGDGDSGEPSPTTTALPPLEAGVIPNELDAFLSQIGVAPEQMTDIAFSVDEDAGPLYPIDAERSGFEAPYLALRGYFAATLDVSPDAAATLDRLFPCDNPVESRLVACSQPEEAFPSGEIILLGGLLAGDFPLDDPGHSYDIGGFFMDDDPPDRGPPSGQFDPSFLLDTNRWYELQWSPARDEWHLTVSNVVAQARMPAESNDRAVIDGSLFAFFVTEGGPLFEVRALGSDEEGTYSNETSGGDVSGPDPKTAMNPVPSEPITIEPPDPPLGTDEGRSFSETPPGGTPVESPAFEPEADSGEN
jgi:hypothetical protein